MNERMMSGRWTQDDVQRIVQTIGGWPMDHVDELEIRGARLEAIMLASGYLGSTASAIVRMNESRGIALDDETGRRESLGLA